MLEVELTLYYLHFTDKNSIVGMYFYAHYIITNNKSVSRSKTETKQYIMY